MLPIFASQRAGGFNQDDLTIVASLFDSDGNYVDGTEKNIDMKLSDQTLKEWSRTGATTELKFDLKPGSYIVRVVVRDSNAAALSAENGTVQVPQ